MVVNETAQEKPALCDFWELPYSRKRKQRTQAATSIPKLHSANTKTILDVQMQIKQHRFSVYKPEAIYVQITKKVKCM